MVRKKLAIPDPCLCLVTNLHLLAGADLVPIVRDAVSGGVRLVQLREKNLPGAELLKLAREIKHAIKDRALLIVNERLDVAMASGADGVHLGESSLPVSTAIQITANNMLVGKSVHSVGAAIAADQEGADYLLAGTIFRTSSKPGVKPQGPALIRSIVRVTHKPVLGIGGITSKNAASLIDAGAIGIAAMSSILASTAPRQAAESLLGSMKKPPLPARQPR